MTGVDIFKLFAAFGVVAIHVGLPILKTFGRIGVPFFVIISSFFFFRHYGELTNEAMKKSYLIKFEKRILHLFLSWEIFYIPLLIRNNSSLFKNGGVNINTISKFIFDFLYPIPSNGNGWGPSWYLIAMMIGLPIFIYIYKSFNIYVIAFISVILESYYVAATGYGYLTQFVNFRNI